MQKLLDAPSTSNRHIGLFGPHIIVTTGHGDHGVFSHRDHGAAGTTYGTTDSEERGKFTGNPGGTSSSTSALPEETMGTF